MIDTTIESFQADVIEGSRDVPVLLDFWAPWCGPCKSLGPLLERLETDYAGRFRLVKINTDDQPELAQHFRIRSIPTVYAFVDGRPVDQFQGALPEGKLREFIDRLMPNPAEIEVDAAFAAVEAGDTAGAIDHLKRALALDPAHDEARLAWAQLLVEADDAGAAQSQLDALGEAIRQDPRVQVLQARVSELAEQNRVPGAPDLEARIARDPDDLGARLALARHCIEYKAWEPALEQLMEIVRRDRGFEDDVGRRTMLEVFGLAHGQPELVAQWRRRLGSALN